MVRIEPTAEASFAAIRDLRRFGIAMAAMNRMMATTISNSIREKPFCVFMMLDLLDNFYVARARYTYRKPETNAAVEVIARSVSCSTLIINRLLKLRRMSSLHLSAANGQKSLILPFFVHHQKHKSSLLIMTRRLRRCGFPRRVNPTGCASWHSDGRSEIGKTCALPISVSCSTLIINRLLKLRRMSSLHLSAANGQKSLILPFFVHHQKHKSSLLIMTRRLRRCGFPRRVNPTGCASWHSDGRSGN